MSTKPAPPSCGGSSRPSGRAGGCCAAACSRRRSSQRCSCARLVDVLLVELERQRRRAREDPSSSTCSSISPVGRFGLTVSAARFTTSPVAWMTNSLRSSCASRPRPARVGVDHELRPCRLRSRRSTKTSPPWSRRVSTQPATVTRPAGVGAPQLAAHRSRQAGYSSASVVHDAVVLAAPAHLVRPVGARDDDRLRAEPLGLGELPLHRAASVIGVDRAALARHFAICGRTRPRSSGCLERDEEVEPRRLRLSRPPAPSRASAARARRRSRSPASAARRPPRRDRRTGRRRRSSS